MQFLKSWFKQLPTKANAVAGICDGEPLFLEEAANETSYALYEAQCKNLDLTEMTLSSANWHAVFTAVMQKHALANFNADAEQIYGVLTRWYIENYPNKLANGLLDIAEELRRLPVQTAISLYTDYYHLKTVVGNLDVHGPGKLRQQKISHTEIQLCINALEQRQYLAVKGHTAVCETHASFCPHCR